MKLPYEIVILILSYFSVEEIKHVHIPYQYYKQYLNTRVNIKSERWVNGMYNNLHNKCFKCADDYGDSYFMVICMKCELLLNDYCNYPLICKPCVNNSKMVRGKVLCSTCPSCLDKKMHIIISNKLFE